jgi:hypothetical protein
VLINQPLICSSFWRFLQGLQQFASFFFVAGQILNIHLEAMKAQLELLQLELLREQFLKLEFG